MTSNSGHGDVIVVGVTSIREWQFLIVGMVI